MVRGYIYVVAEVPRGITRAQTHRYRYQSKKRYVLNYFFTFNYKIDTKTYITAAKRLSTTPKKARNKPGPIKPIEVINLRTERIDQFPIRSESATCPATKNKYRETLLLFIVDKSLPIPTRELTTYGTAVRLIDFASAPKLLARYVGSHCMIIYDDQFIAKCAIYIAHNGLFNIKSVNRIDLDITYKNIPFIFFYRCVRRNNVYLPSACVMVYFLP